VTLHIQPCMKFLPRELTHGSALTYPSVRRYEPGQAHFIFNSDYWSYWEHTITTPPHGHPPPPPPQVLGDGLNYGGVSCDVVGGVS
jgi:hypothetical protein